MLFSMLNIGIMIGAVALLKNINVYLGLGIVGVLYIVATVVINKYLYNNQNKLADNII